MCKHPLGRSPLHHSWQQDSPQGSGPPNLFRTHITATEVRAGDYRGNWVGVGGWEGETGRQTVNAGTISGTTPYPPHKRRLGEQSGFG